MIGQINPESESFGGLISYIESGKGGLHPGRVAWMEFYNLPTRKPRVAACYMAATGRSSISCTRKPVYHFSVSFAPDDPVDEAMMRRVARRTLRDMGLEEYKCAVFAHRDRSHIHLHFVVCRVHPVRRTLWRNWRDRTRLEYSLRAQEVEFGLQVVPGWLAPVPVVVDHARDELAQDRQPEARWLKPRPAPRRGDAAFLRDVTERATPVLAQADTWAELERGLAEQGLSLRVKGGGFRITDGEQQVKASEVGRDFSRYHLEKSFGRYPDYRARMAVAGIARVRLVSLVQPEASPQQQEQPSPPFEAPSATPAAALDRSDAVVEHVPAPQASLAQPSAHPLATSSDDALLANVETTTRTAAPEPLPDPAPQPSFHSSPPETHGPVQSDLQPVEPPKRTRPRKPVHFLKEVKKRGGPAVLKWADSWEALERGLADRGLSLRVKGGGFVVTDGGEQEVKASKVGREFSRFYLEERLGPYPGSGAGVAASGVEPVPPAPAVRDEIPAQGPEQPAPAPEQIELLLTGEAPPAHAPQPDAPPEQALPVGTGSHLAHPQLELPLSAAQLELPLSASTAQPPQPAAPPEPTVPPPQPHGTLQSGVQRNDFVPAADAASVSQSRDRPWIDVALDEAAKRLHVLEKWDAADAVLRDSRDAASVAGTAARALDAWKSPAVVVRAHLRQSAKLVYLDPESAVRELLDHARDERTLEEAKEWLRTWPEYFGKLEPDMATGLARLRPWNTFGTARRNARGLIDRLDAAARHEWKRPEPEAYTRAAEEVEKTEAAVDAASAARDAVSKLSRKSLMERVALALEPLRAAIGHEEIERRLGHKLTPEAVYLLPEAMKVAVTLAEGPRQERNGYGFEV